MLIYQLKLKAWNSSRQKDYTAVTIMSGKLFLCFW